MIVLERLIPEKKEDFENYTNLYKDMTQYESNLKHKKFVDHSYESNLKQFPGILENMVLFKKYFKKLDEEKIMKLLIQALYILEYNIPQNKPFDGQYQETFKEITKYESRLSTGNYKMIYPCET
ncbi:MAG: hypothetical protein IKL88_06370, partial [Erysipelotrichales bacterium]|nr:hypothetical protein [Erysipelotrichales bacterium]